MDPRLAEERFITAIGYAIDRLTSEDYLIRNRLRSVRPFSDQVRRGCLSTALADTLDLFGL
jgi:hypothetical protein